MGNLCGGTNPPKFDVDVPAKQPDSQAEVQQTNLVEETKDEHNQAAAEEQRIKQEQAAAEAERLRLE